MKLLFDEHLSFRVIRSLQDVYPEARHVRFFQLESCSDDFIWNKALKDGFAIVTKDEDFKSRVQRQGHPPKVVFLELPNSKNSMLEELLRSRAKQIQIFINDPLRSILVLNA